MGGGDRHTDTELVTSRLNRPTGTLSEKLLLLYILYGDLSVQYAVYSTYTIFNLHFAIFSTIPNAAQQYEM